MKPERSSFGASSRKFRKGFSIKSIFEVKIN